MGRNLRYSDGDSSCSTLHNYNTRSKKSNRRRRRQTPSPTRQVACATIPERQNFFTRNKNSIKIALIIIVLAATIKCISDHTISSLQSDMVHLKNNLQDMQKELYKIIVKKNDVEKQLIDISTTLPQLKDMAYQVKKGVKNCHRYNHNDDLRFMIKEELKVYNADKTGKTDFALESSGGKIITVRKTECLHKNPSVLTFFGIPLCQSANSPRAMIQSGVMPGECWAFKGSAGNAVIHLISNIKITGVSLEHISKSISPTGETKTAPKEFSLWGLERVNDPNPFYFGKFVYQLNSSTIQYYPVAHKTENTYDMIEFKVHSNHGHSEYTCVYRLRVHGELGNA